MRNIDKSRMFRRMAALLLAGALGPRLSPTPAPRR